MNRKDKERALAALLEGNPKPLAQLKRSNLPLIYLQAEEAEDGMLKNVVVQMWTSPEQELERHEIMSSEEFEALRKRISRKALPWVEIRVPSN